MNNNKKSIVIYSDFDGTITLRDSCDDFFRRFGDFDAHITELASGNIAVKEYYNRVCSTLPEELSEEDIEQFASECETDPYFTNFVKFCESNSLPLTIITDGFDRYILPILKRLQVNVTVKCNLLPGKKPVFLGATESCDCFCASCKRNSMLNVSDETIIVYIGDGISDYCAVEYADIVFAKEMLAAYCNENKIPHHPFRSFSDIIFILQKYLKNGVMRKRRQADLRRIAAFVAE